MMDRLQGYENVDHVLAVLADMHRCIHQLIGELGGKASDDRRKMALGYLAEQHAKRSAVITSYRQDAEPTLLRQWLQTPFPQQPDDLVRSLTSICQGEPSIEYLMSEIDNFTDRLLHHLSDRAETANAQALLQNLRDIEDRERHLRSRDLSSFSQI